MGMSVKERFIRALSKEVPDRLPVTTHHVMQSFLNKYMNGMGNDEFFKFFGFDPIVWTGEYRQSYYEQENWKIETEELSDPTYKTVRYHFITPKGRLTMVTQSNQYTSWFAEHLIKDKKDIEILAEYLPAPECNVEKVNEVAKSYGEDALIRGTVTCFDVFGQPGCWQDATCLVGIERLIMETYDDSAWVHELLKILKERKKRFLQSTKGAEFDIMELGGGDASTTVISPSIFQNFVAPYDSELIQTAHEAGQRIVYHICGGMMPILEDIAAMRPEAMETFTPAGMGGDTNLKEAKRRIRDKVCMIGGFDQFHFFTGCSENETRAEVRRCFEEAGANGGYILCPSDHFFDADLKLIKAFVDEAQKCIYSL